MIQMLTVKPWHVISADPPLRKKVTTEAYSGPPIPDGEADATHSEMAAARELLLCVFHGRHYTNCTAWCAGDHDQHTSIEGKLQMVWLQGQVSHTQRTQALRITNDLASGSPAVT